MGTSRHEIFSVLRRKNLSVIDDYVSLRNTLPPILPPGGERGCSPSPRQQEEQQAQDVLLLRG